MPTKKRRIPVTLSKELESVLVPFAKENDISLSRTIQFFLHSGIKHSEDDILMFLAEERDTKEAVYISHEDAWK